VKYFSADLIFTNLGTPLRNHIVVTDNDGVILDITNSDQVSGDVINVNGAIVPGFINAHCHLELSHLKNQLPTGTGLIPFIKSVVTLRDFPESEILEAIDRADEEMYRNGIVAVGDISNKSDTAECKSKSRLKYYTFVEMFDFLQENQARSTFDNYLEVLKSQSASNNNKKSCVPHAPYSVSVELFRLINAQNSSEQTVSIHNQETWHENAFFKNRKGDFINFYKDFGINISEFAATGKNSIYYAIDNMSPKANTLFVHNTMTEEEDIINAQSWNSNCFWVTCPNANLYIENKLPHYQKFIDQGARMCIGTDSLSSNWQLSILEELKTIEKYQSYIETELLVKWSSFHAAEALGYDNLGVIGRGKKPGLVALESNGMDPFRISEVRRCYRLI